MLSISVMSKYVTRWRAPDPMLGALVVDIVGYGSRLRSAGELSADFLSFFGARAMLCDSGPLRRSVK